MKLISFLLCKYALKIVRYAEFYRLHSIRAQLGCCEESTILRLPDVCSYPPKIYLAGHTSIYEGARFIISPIGEKGKFIMKHHSSAAQGLTIITGNHHRMVGKWLFDIIDTHHCDIDADVVIEEDVLVGAGVTILGGVRIGRGASIGAGSVCITSIPPYAIVMGNPAQVVGFVFTPNEIIEHEKALYPEEERLPLAKLEKNYQRFYLNQTQTIAKYLNITIR